MTYYRKHRKAGICGACTRKPEGGHSRCPACLDSNARSRTKRVKRLQAKGRCECGRIKRTIRFVKCAVCRQRGREHYRKDPKKVLAINKKSYLAQQAKVFAGYGNKCACCGEADSRFFTVDHVHNDGKKHRKKVGVGGNYIYTWIVKNNFPTSMQILCWNCNLGKSKHGGVCPHKIARNFTRGGSDVDGRAATYG